MKMRASTLVAACAVLSITCGCSTSNLSKTAFLSPKNPHDDLAGGFDKTVRGNMGRLGALEAEYYSTTNEDTKRSRRDQIEQILVGSIDEYWRQFATNFNANYGLAKTLTEGGGAALSGAAAITTPARAAKILSAVSAGVIGFGTATEKDIFEGNAAYILIGQMDADRLQIQATIKANIAKPTTEYTLNQMYIDIDNYAACMSLPHALSALNGKVGQQANDNQKSQYPGAGNPAATVTLQPSSLTLPTGQTATFVVSGGSGTGVYVWGGAAAGTGPSVTVKFQSTGPQKVTVYRAADTSNVQSNTATASIIVQDPPIDATFSASTTTLPFTGFQQALVIAAAPNGATYSTSGTAAATSPGSYTVTVTGTGSYQGSSTIAWKIAAPAGP